MMDSWPLTVPLYFACDTSHSTWHSTRRRQPYYYSAWKNLCLGHPSPFFVAEHSRISTSLWMKNVRTFALKVKQLLIRTKTRDSWITWWLEMYTLHNRSCCILCPVPSTKSTCANIQKYARRHPVSYFYAHPVEPLFWAGANRWTHLWCQGFAQDGHRPKAHKFLKAQLAVLWSPMTVFSICKWALWDGRKGMDWSSGLGTCSQ